MIFSGAHCWEGDTTNGYASTLDILSWCLIKVAANGASPLAVAAQLGHLLATVSSKEGLTWIILTQKSSANLIDYCKQWWITFLTYIQYYIIHNNIWSYFDHILYFFKLDILVFGSVVSNISNMVCDDMPQVLPTLPYPFCTGTPWWTTGTNWWWMHQL